MEFYEVLDRIVDLLRQRRRVSYRALKLQFALDDDAIEAVQAELIEAQQLACDEQGAVLVWIGPEAPPPEVTSTLSPAPLAYTPPHLAEKILTVRRELAGEQKQVTVLLVHMHSSLEGLAPGEQPEARALLAPVVDSLLAAIHRLEGTVTQVRQEGIVALFGAPLAHEDHAVRACYAALAMQEAVRSYSTEVRRSHGIEVQIRVGLHTGDVVVHTIDDNLQMDYAAIGHTTHLATRLGQSVPLGSIRLTAETLRLVEGLVQVTPLGAMPIQGMAEAVAVFELTGAGATRRRLQATAARGLTQFVGRQHELEALRQALERAGAGDGQVGALVGEPGVGKSRLVYEFVHSHRTEGWLILESSSASYGRATPYFPVMDMLQAYFQIETRDDGRRIREKITGKLLTLDPTLGATLPAFLALLDARLEDRQWQSLDPPQRRQRTLEALTGLLLRESQEQPVLLVCEDLHWIDTETQDLLDALVERLPSARLLLLVNYRPGYQPPWSTKEYYTQLRIEPLPPASVEVLLRALLGEDDSLTPLTPLLIARTEGNPFFLEESVRTLVEMGFLHGAPGAYRLTQPLVSLQVPATVQAMLAARIDRLPLEAKHLLQTAAVIGHEVLLPLLRALADRSEMTLQHGLAHLQTAGFLDETCLFPEVEYTFKHALTHEVTYGNLLQERRRALHARIVGAIEQLTPNHLHEQVERMAHHAVRGEVWDKAVAYCYQAGTRAIAHSAYQQVVTYFEQALEALRRLPECPDTQAQAIDIRLDLRNAFWPLGELERNFVCLQDAAALAEVLGDAPRLGAVTAYLLAHFVFACEPEPALVSGQRALAIAVDLRDVGLTVVTQYYLGLAHRGLGDYQRATEYFRNNVACLSDDLLHERFGLVGLASVHSRGVLTCSLAECGAFAEGMAAAAEAVRIAEAANHPYSRVVAYWAVGFQWLRQGDLGQAIPALQRSLGLAQATHIHLLIPWVGSALGAAYALAGRSVEALPLLESVVAQGLAMRLLADHALRVAWLSEAYLGAGQLDEACSQAQRALEFARHHQERGHEAYALRLLGEVAAQREAPEAAQATTHYHAALALAEELGMRPLQAHCHRGLGTLYARLEQWEQSRLALAMASQLYRAMDMTFWLPSTEAALAQPGA